MVDDVLAFGVELLGRRHSRAFLAAREDHAESLRVQQVRRLEAKAAIRAGDEGGWAIGLTSHGPVAIPAVAYGGLRRRPLLRFEKVGEALEGRLRFRPPAP